MSIDWREVKQLIYDYFSLEELYSLSFDLGISYEDFPDKGKDAFSRNLVEYVQRHGNENDFFRALATKRPNVSWPSFERSKSPQLKQVVPNHTPTSHTAFQSPFGTMPPDSPLYIEREADNECWKYLTFEPVTTISIQAPRQMGKSSLMRRMARRMEQEYQVKTAFIDLEQFSLEHIENEDAFFTELCLSLGECLGVNEAIDEYWKNPRLSNTRKCTNYVSGHVVSAYGKPFIIALDETERLFRTRWQNDFFGMLRAWHNARAWNPAFGMFTIFLSCSTEPYLFIDNPNQSPFNVAHHVNLSEFTASQIRELNNLHGHPLSDQELEGLYSWIGGHPFLNRLAFYRLVTESITPSNLLEPSLMVTYSPLEQVLRRYWGFISEEPELKASLAQICFKETHPEDKRYYRLQGAGLVKRQGSKTVMANPLYAHYFRERLRE